MINLPDLQFKNSSLYTGTRNIKGLLCNIYTPLLNLADEKTKKLGDFTSEHLSFDMEHPVDIILLDSYDGAVNMVINDGKNRPRLINSRFAVQDENTFKIPDHSGFKDTNIYDEETFDVDTLLKAIPIKIPVITYDGLINNGGKLNCGTYTFYFKLADADGNETEVIAESGIVQCHIGDTNSPKSARMGLENENSSKAIKFTLSNIDAGFDYVHVLFSKTSSGEDQAAVTTYSKIMFDFPVDKNGICEITITGAETIIGISKEECNVDYADINSVKTQAVNNNVLLFGNIDTPEHDWDAIKRFTWKIIPRWSQTASGAIGTLDYNYDEQSITKDLIEDHGFCYYNTKNVYYRLGYWPGEIYRFGIVYIFNDNSLSPVINLLGIDWSNNKVQNLYNKSISPNNKTRDKLSVTTSEADDYESLFFSEELNIENSRYPEYLYEEDELYFNKKYRTNSRGVVRFPENINVKEVSGQPLSPKPLYINFDLSLIGYKYAKKPSGNSWNEGDVVIWKDVLKKHNIKGFFFVRQKRVPTILGQGLIIGLSHKECGSLPVIQDENNNVIVLPFLAKTRILEEQAEDFSIPAYKRIYLGPEKGNENLFKNQAMLCPDAEVDEPTFNLLFVSNDFCLYKEGLYSFSYSNFSANINGFSPTYSSIHHITKLTNVPEDTKLLTNGTDYFSTLAGNPHEPYKTVNILRPWRWTKPLDLTVSTSLLRGKWGPFVGLNNPNENNPLDSRCPFSYGEVYNIRTSNYSNPEIALELDFLKVMTSNSPFFAISHRTEMVKLIDCFRGDCYISMFTHRMFRNFIDPELPTNNLIVDPSCWMKNYGVRCTAEIIETTHSNLTKDSEGWVIGEENQKDALVQALIYFLTGNIVGIISSLVLAERSKEISEENFGKDDAGNELKTEGDADSKQYPNGYANEIVLAFEVYIGNAAFNPLMPLTSLITKLKNLNYKIFNVNNPSHYWDEPEKKKVNPKEQEKSGGINLKAIFKSDDDWELRGLSGINRADVNAVAMGQWITFPILSNKNLAFRDIDFSNATEEASFNRKRSFFPLQAKDRSNPLRDSNVINHACSITLPEKPYMQLPKVPYFKQEYFTRIQNSLRDSASSITNEFKIMLESAYHDYNKLYGSITKLESKDNYVFIIFKHGIGILDMVSAINQAKDATLFLPEVSIISDTYGSIWKDSIILTPTGIYGVDSVAKVIWKIEGTAVKIISDMKVEKFLIDNLDMSEFNFRPYIGHINIKTHYNAFKHDVMFTYYNDLLYELPEGYSISEGYSVDLDGFVIDSTGRRYKGIEDSTLYGKAKRLLPYYKTKDEDGDGEVDQEWKSYSELINDAGVDHCCWVKGTTWSLCWNEDLSAFLTFYDWVPLESENIDNIYFSFDKDGIEEVKENFKDYILFPSFSDGVKTYNTLKLGTLLNKNLIDSAFTNTTKVYFIKGNYAQLTDETDLITVFDSQRNNRLPYNIKAGELAVFSCYLRGNNPTITIEHTNGSITCTPNKVNMDLWIFISLFIKSKEDISINSIKIECKYLDLYLDYYLCEPKLISYVGNITYSDGDGYIDYNLQEIEKENGLFKQYYEIRSTDNSLKLWKHGQAGVYDNQGKIKPTNWYGKQHEFNFEFIVNENASILKIFNNLKIISNKTAPNKFEYEIVGEGYDWFEYKPIIQWINDQVKCSTYRDLLSGYKYVLSTPYKVIKSEYQDFPELFEYSNRTDNWKIPKLPYLEVKLSDKKGLPDKSKSYTKVDAWSSIDSPLNKNDYTFNTSEPIIIEDNRLHEYRIHTEQLGNDVKKYGRLRGNMQYLEDLWNIEIRPIKFNWTYLKNGELEFTPSKEARHRDKYIKIKVRYSGEDLAVIQGIITMFDYSMA